VAPRERGPVGVATEDDDLLGPEPAGGDHAAQADGPVTDDRHALAVCDVGGECRVVAGAHHVRERQQRGQQRVVLADWQDHEGSVGVGDTDRLGLGAVDPVRAEDASLDARRLQPLMAELAPAIGVRPRHDDEVADLRGAHLGADRLDDADGLVSKPPPGVGLVRALIGPLPQIAARVMTTRASVGSIRVASGTFSMRTSPAP